MRPVGRALSDDVVELANRLPIGDKVCLRGEKRVVRDAEQGLLPPSTLAGPERGQGNPLWLWARDGFRDRARDLLSEAALQGRGYLRPAAIGRSLARFERGLQHPFELGHVYSLLLLEVWHRVFIDPPTIAPPEVPPAC